MEQVGIGYASHLTPARPAQPHPPSIRHVEQHIACHCRDCQDHRWQMYRAGYSVDEINLRMSEPQEARPGAEELAAMNALRR